MYSKNGPKVSPRYVALSLRNATRRAANVSFLEIMSHPFFTIRKRGGYYPGSKPPKVLLRPKEWGFKGVSREQKRRCIVKISFKNNGTPKGRSDINRFYLKYISREIASLRDKPVYEDAEKGRELYTITPAGGKIFMSAEDAAKKLGSDYTFRIILSPEDSSIDLDQLVQKFMYSSFYGINGMGERSKGFVVCNHYNTTHPHAHILVSRKSEKPGGSDELKIPSSYVRDFAHKEASFICSCIGGPRSKREYMESERKKIERRGLCSYDYLIKKNLKPIKQPDEKGKERVSHYVIGDKELDGIHGKHRKPVRRRLNFLAQLYPDYVQRELNGTYVLDKNWIKCLETSDYLKIAGLEERAKTEKVIIDNGPEEDRFRTYTGTVKEVAVADDFEEKLLLTIEDTNGKLHLLDFNSSLDDMDHLKGAKVDVAKVRQKATVVSRTLD